MMHAAAAVLPALLQSKTPKLLVWGEDDGFQTVDYAERYERQIPQNAACPDQVGWPHSDGE